MISKLKRASSVIDYSLLVVGVVTALLIIGVYLKRGISANIREGADAFGHGRQYDGSN